jgi:LPS sulfotransferase NodH
MLGDDQRLAWILGSSRSGSTWLLRMLERTGQIAPIDDPHLGHHLGIWRPIPLAWGTAVDEPELGTLDEVKRDKASYFFSDRYRSSWLPALRALVESRFRAEADEYAATNGIDTPAIVVKEPGSQAASLLLDLFPSASLIFLLRDGRDVVDSWLDAYQRNSWAQEEGAFPVARKGRIALIQWLSSVWVFRVRAVWRAYGNRDPARRVLVRYEDLLDDAVGELERIAETIGLDADRRKLSDAAGALEFDRLSPSERGDGKEARRAEPGAWRTNLSRVEQRAMIETLQPALAEFGYDRPAAGPARAAA